MGIPVLAKQCIKIDLCIDLPYDVRSLGQILAIRSSCIYLFIKQMEL